MTAKTITTSILQQKVKQRSIPRLEDAPAALQIQVYRETLTNLAEYLDAREPGGFTVQSLSLIRDDVLTILMALRRLSSGPPTGDVTSLDETLENLRTARDAIQAVLAILEAGRPMNLRKLSAYSANLRRCQAGILRAGNLLMPPTTAAELHIDLAQIASPTISGSTKDLIKSRPGSKPSTDKPAGAGTPADEVSFTAFYPKEGPVDTWHTLLVYIHLVSALEAVRRDAGRFKDELPAPRETTFTASTPIVRGTDITIVPTCEGVTFNPPRTTIRWLEDYHRADFRFRADTSLLEDAGKGYITFFVGPVIIGTLKFSMLFSDGATAPVPDQADSTTMYHKDKIFISYSHKDTDVVQAFKKVHEATGYDVMIDIDDLRAGQEWNPALMHMIDCADIFQLFWSENSRKSKYCRQEWKHALERATAGFIRPVYWQTPLPKPPRELSQLHFEYVEL